MTQKHYDKRIIVYDGVCILCNHFVQWLIKRDRNKAFFFTTLQSELGQQLVQDHKVQGDTVVLWNKGKIFTKSDVAIESVKYLSWQWKIFGVAKVLPLGFRNWIYDTIALNRYKWFGKHDSCMLPSPEIKDRFI